MTTGSGDVAGQAAAAVSPKLQAALAAAALPGEVVAAWNATDAEPFAGQLWRAAWGDVAEMVLLTHVAQGSVTAFPVTVDVDFADELTAVLPSKMSTVGFPLAVWTGLVRELPLFVLDRQVGTVDAHWVQRDELLAAVADGSAFGGSPVTDPVDRRHEYRAELTDALDTLAAATWVPAGSGTLGTLLRAAGAEPAALAGQLGVEPQAVLALLRGQLPVTAEQATVLGPTVGATPEDVLAANPTPPADLVARLDQPRRRRQLQALAQQRGTDERTARLDVAYGTWRLAARQTGGQTAPAWDERLDRYFHVNLDGSQD